MRLPGVMDGSGGLLARLAFWFSRRKFGKVLAPTRLYAHSPRILRAVGGLYGVLEKPLAAPARLLNLTKHHAARLIGCPF